MKRLLIALALFLAAPTAAFAQQDTALTQINARNEIAAALYGASATQAAAERAADARLRAQAAEIARLRRDGRVNRMLIAELEEKYVADLAGRDRAFAQEIAIFRGAVEDIAATPEGAAALARFNTGDEVGALSVLDSLAEARQQARRARANIETAEELRRIAALALDARTRGRLDSPSALKRFETIVALDPGVFWDWVDLGRLYQDMGRTADARAAIDRAARLAVNARDRSIVNDELADLLIDLGDRAAAMPHLRASLAISRARLSDQPRSSNRIRDVAFGAGRLASALREDGELQEATALHEEQIALYRRLVAANTNADNDQRSLVLSLVSYGRTLRVAGQPLKGAQAHQEALDLCRELVSADPTNLRAKRDLSSALTMSSVALMDSRKPIEALQASNEAIAIGRQALESDPTSARSVLEAAAVARAHAGLLIQAGKREEALAYFAESLTYVRRLQALDPDLASTKLELVITLDSAAANQIALRRFADAETSLNEALSLAEMLFQKDPTRDIYRLARGRTLEGAGNLAFARSDHSSALTRLNEALDHFRQLQQSNPSVVDYKQRIGSTMLTLAQIPNSGVTLPIVEKYYTDLQTTGVEVTEQDRQSLLLLRLATALDSIREPAAALQPTVAIEQEAQSLHAKGQLREALLRYRESERMRRAIPVSGLATAFVKRALADTLDRIGLLLIFAGSPAEADPVFVESVQLRRDVLRTAPTAWNYRNSLSESVNNLASLRAAQGRLQEADALAVEALQLARETYTSKPKDGYVAMWRALSTASDTKLFLGDVANARAVSAELLQLVEQRIALEPQSLDAQRPLSTALLAHARAVAISGEREIAQDLVRRNLTRQEVRVVAAPDDYNEQWDLAVAVGNVAETYRLFGDARRAEVNFRRAEQLTARLVQQKPELIWLQWDLLEMRFRLAQLRDDAHQLDEAVKTYLRLGGKNNRPFYLSWIEDLERIASNRGAARDAISTELPQPR